MKALLDAHLPRLAPLLTPPRLQHSLAVMAEMTALAPLYALDPVQAAAAGLLHDAARDLAPERQLKIIDEAGILLSDPCERHPVYAHALAGAQLAQRLFNVEAQPVLDAIRAHSYVGSGRMLTAPLSQCLRFADILAPTQPWLGMNRLRGVVYAGRAAEAALLQCGWLIEFLQAQAIPVHPNITRQYHSLISQKGVDDTFFDRW